MIRLGLRLTLGGGRQAAPRLAVTAAGVAIGVTLLLVTLAGINAITAQNQRAAWLATGSAPARHGSTAAATATPAADPLWWLVSTGRFGTQVIYRVDVAATGPRSPVPPSIPRLPGPGQYYASPALSTLLRTTPAAELGDRFGGRQAGTIGPAALPAPDSLIIIVGHSPGQLSAAPGVQEVTGIQALPGSGSGPAGLGSPLLEAILAVAAAALLFPVLIFIGAATRLAAARREQRFAVIRLAGRGRGLEPHRTAAGAALTAGRSPARHPARAPRLAGDPAAGRPGLAGRRAGHRPVPGSGQQDAGLPAGLPADPGRAGHRRPLADHDRIPAHGPPCAAARQPARPPHRRPAAGRRPPRRLPRRQRPDPGPVRHHRCRRSDHHQRRRAAPEQRHPGQRHPV
jgi:hypothetical protein